MMPAQPGNDEFYIGYDGGMPPRIARRVRAAVACVAGATAAVVIIVTVATEKLAPARFEFGIITEVTGHLRRLPYPVLETGGRRVWLAGPGKFGADALLAGVPDGPVTLSGSRIQRGRHEMLEVRAGGVRSLGSPTTADAPSRGLSRAGLRKDLGRVSLQGEIVDSKCFLGVMNPGSGAVHRDCGTRCLRGGMPPALVVRDGDLREELVLLVAADARTAASGSPRADRRERTADSRWRPIGRDLASMAGRSIEVSGHLERDGPDYVLYVSGWRQPAGGN